MGGKTYQNVILTGLVESLLLDFEFSVTITRALGHECGLDAVLEGGDLSLPPLPVGTNGWMDRMT